jgi:hypothetical protein
MKAKKVTKRNLDDVSKILGVRDILSLRGINPVDEVIRLLQSGAVNEDKQLEAWLKLCSMSYALPKVEAAPIESQPITINIKSTKE